MKEPDKIEIDVTAETLIAIFIRIRDRIAEIKEQQLAPLEEAKNIAVGKLLEFLDKTGQESARTNAGTVTAAIRTDASLADPDVFMDYVIDTGLFELLERRASKTACTEFLEAKGELPPGVRLHSVRTVNVRKPS